MSAIASAPDPAAAPKFELTASRQFAGWMGEQRIALAFTTYQAGKLFLLGLNPEGRLSVEEIADTFADLFLCGQLAEHTRNGRRAGA